jgi:catechol 2,3-dioxygenase-like lactoylglutathione lyase family enzyme
MPPLRGGLVGVCAGSFALDGSSKPKSKLEWRTIVNLNHIDLPTIDISATRSFFEHHFGFRCIFARGDGLTVLLDEDNFALTLSPLPDGEKLYYPSGFHIGFNVDSEHELYEAHGRLAAAGVPIVRQPSDLGGALAFHCRAPGPILVEISYRPRD